MKREHGFQRLFHAVGGSVLCIFLMFPRSESSVDGAVAIEKESGKGKIVVELKFGEVESIRVDEPDADELIEQGSQLGVFHEDLSIESGTGEARNASEGDHDGFPCLCSFGEGGFEIVVDPSLTALEVFPVISHGSLTVFDCLGLGNG